MSHQPERIEKDCLNCGADVKGMYCQACGQKNAVVHQSFWQLATHFIYDIFHFDGKFFDTLKGLLFRPGLVPKQYVQGRRLSYLDPIRMYLFTSAIFFLVFFSISKKGFEFISDDDGLLSTEKRLQLASAIFQTKTNLATDTTTEKKLGILLDTSRSVSLQPLRDTVLRDSSAVVTLNNKFYLLIPERTTPVDSIKKAGTNWLEKNALQKWQFYKKAYGDDLNRMLRDLNDRFLHWFPYILFVSLPFFALILKLLYLRRKTFFYSDHAVFTLYHYIFSLITLLVLIGLETLHDVSRWAIFEWLQTLISFFWIASLFLSLKRFYGQGTGKTFIKFLLVNLLGLVSFLVIFVCILLVFIFQL